MKKYVALLPFRAMLKFFYLYVWNLGFLDGQAGLRYSLLQSIYEYMIVLKIDELHRKKRTTGLIPSVPSQILPTTFENDHAYV